MARSRMKGEFDFARALGVGAFFLPGDLDRARPGPRGVEEVYARRGEGPVLEGEPVRTGCERLGRRGEFYLNDSPPGEKFGGDGEWSGRGKTLLSSPPLRTVRAVE
jgi:hypothetical protein